jgi:diguanylate cyclase (GGDEF)-like protein
MQKNKKKLHHVNALLIAVEVVLISFLDYSLVSYYPFPIGQYISLDVLYSIPILQVARFASIHSMRSSDTQTSTFVGIGIAIVWSATEMLITWPYFPIAAFILNTFTRSVVFTVIFRVVVKLWREREFAYVDFLTGLANRVELLERLKIEQGRSERSGRPFSLLFIDIDEFKSINDTYGHKGGDEALKVLAEVLRKCCRKVDVPVRLGGDEFVVLLPDTDEQSSTHVVKRIERSVALAFERQPWRLTVSIGKMTSVGKSHDADSVIHIADEDMYQAKKMKEEMQTRTPGAVSPQL